MNLYLYNTSKDAKYLIKDDLQYKGLLSGSLMNTCDIINPSILVEMAHFNQEIVNSNNVEAVDSNGNEVLYTIGLNYDFNYCYLDTFKRYYYIDDIDFVTSKNMYVLKLHCDVLFTYKDYLLTLDAWVSRNEYLFDSDIEDDIAPTMPSPYVEENDIVSDGDLVNTSLRNDYDFNTILTYTYCGQCVDTDFDGAISGTVNGVSILPSINLANNFSGIGCAVTMASTTLATLKEDDNQASFVYSLLKYPFQMGYEREWKRIIFSKKDLNIWIIHIGGQPDIYGDYYAGKMKLDNYYHVVMDHTFNEINDDYYSRTAKYEIYVPFVGYVPVEWTQLYQKRVLLVYAVTDLIKGSGMAYLINDTDKRMIYSTNCQLAINLPLTTTNYLERNNNDTIIEQTTALKLLGSGATVLAGGVGQSANAMSKGIISGVNAMADASIRKMTNYLRCQTGILNSNNGFFNKLEPTMRMTKIVPLSSVNYASYAHLYGRPTNQVRNLSEIHGFTTITDIDLSIPSITRTEANELKQLLLNGVYFNQE